MTTEYYIGLMSGTSADGIDAVLADFSAPTPSIKATHYQAYPVKLQQAVLALCENEATLSLQQLGELDQILGQYYAHTVQALLAKTEIDPKQIHAIGNHGQTLRHQPNHATPFTMQCGDPNVIAADTGITTVADFRRRDLALGGQGAPLVPLFHHALFYTPTEDRVIVNIGGQANVTFLPQDANSTTDTPLLAFDTGPGNALMDAWIAEHLQQPFDKGGAWAASGKVYEALLADLLSHPYFQQHSPKSCGREQFNLTWLQQHLDAHASLPPEDVQATLLALSAQSIAQPILDAALAKGRVLVCGGGAYNTTLLAELQKLLPDFTVDTTDAVGVAPDTLEALAFAWLARETLNGRPGSHPSVTGARSPAILGGVYYGEPDGALKATPKNDGQ